MPARKIRVELFDSEGNRYTLAFEGQITREKALRLLDLVELLGGVQSSGANAGVDSVLSNENFSKYDKVRSMVQRHFPVSWFTSREIQSAYEQEFKQPIGLSTVATYLARLADKGVLVKTGASSRLKYKLTPSFPQTTLRQQVP